MDRLATKPWSFGHPATAAVSEKVVSEHPANHSHELAFERLDNGTTNLFQADANTGRGNFISGLTGNNGRKFGVLYDIPLAPLQTPVGLNAANPGGCTGYLPRFAQPIGNSWACPMLDPSKPITSGGDYPYLDHSFMLNTALYDRYYFSGLADRTGSFGTGETVNTLAEDFANGEPLTDPRIKFNPGIGRSADEFTDLVSDEDGYREVAAWQVMEGAFNINSTSVEAWKAMLGSVHDTKAVYCEIDKTAGDLNIADLDPVDADSGEAGSAGSACRPASRKMMAPIPATRSGSGRGICPPRKSKPSPKTS